MIVVLSRQFTIVLVIMFMVIPLFTGSVILHEVKALRGVRGVVIIPQATAVNVNTAVNYSSPPRL